jgi:cytidylate kinase
MERSPRSVESIVEEQVRRWQAERSRSGPRAAAAPPPTIAVSRQYGARGAAVAHVVAEKLGFSYWNRELVDEIARHAHVADRLVRSFDEHHQPSVVETVRSMTVGGALTSTEYFHELTRVVDGIARHGHAVVVGRGVQFLITGACLRVRVVCPLDERVRGLCERRGVTPAVARKEISDNDADRAAFVRDHYHKEVDAPASYDLVVNTGSLGVEAAAEVVIAAFRGRFPDGDRRPST